MDWTFFYRKIRIKSEPRAIYEAWTKPEILSQWFLKSVRILDRQSATIYRMEWVWNNADMATTIEVLDQDENKFVHFSFGHGMEVKVGIEEKDRHCVLSLHQFNIPTDEEAKFNFYAGCMRGWTFWLVNLKAYLEHGIVLHDTSLGKREDLFDFCNT